MAARIVFLRYELDYTILTLNAFVQNPPIFSFTSNIKFKLFNVLSEAFPSLRVSHGPVTVPSNITLNKNFQFKHVILSPPQSCCFKTLSLVPSYA